MISKRVSYGNLDVDPDNGKIWINCPNCLIRMQNLRFNNIEEKFAMLDINGSDVQMIPGNLEFDNYNNFIENISICILPKIMSLNEDKKTMLLHNLLFKIRDEVNLWDN